MVAVKVGYQTAEPGYGSRVFEVSRCNSPTDWRVIGTQPRLMKRGYIVTYLTFRDGYTCTCPFRSHRESRPECDHIVAVRQMLKGVGVQ